MCPADPSWSDGTTATHVLRTIRYNYQLQDINIMLCFCLRLATLLTSTTTAIALLSIINNVQHWLTTSGPQPHHESSPYCIILTVGPNLARIYVVSAHVCVFLLKNQCLDSYTCQIQPLGHICSKRVCPCTIHRSLHEHQPDSSDFDCPLLEG